MPAPIIFARLGAVAARGLGVKITSNAKEIESLTKKRGKDLSKSIKRALSITAQEGKAVIQERTKDGVGYKGGAFKPYSDVYRAFRAKKKRSTTPDLRFYGHMMSAMTTKADKRKATIFFTGAEQAKKAAMNDKKRPFFGFNRQEENHLRAMFKRHLQ